MLRYYYNSKKRRLYAYDNENGFYMSFNQSEGKWNTPVVSFAQVERDNDIDMVEISEELAQELSHGVGFEKELEEYLGLINKVATKEN